MPKPIESGERPLDPITKSMLEAEVIEALRTVEDQHIFVNVYDLGLIYGIEIDDYGRVRITMTFTSEMCPSKDELHHEVMEAVSNVPRVKSVEIDVVWEPSWQESMPEHIKLHLGLI